MNWDYIYTTLPKFIEASLLTLELATWSIMLSLLIGLILSMVTFYRWLGLAPIVQGYIELSRNTPLLIQIFFLYFGLSKIGIKLDGFSCAIIGLTFLGSSYMAEALRAGFQAVPNKQIEAALSLGLTPLQIFYHIIFPQGFAIAIPAIGANCLFLIKETSVVSAIAIAELMFIAKEVIGLDYKTNEALFLLVICYLVILLPVSIAVRYLERRTRRAEYGV